MDKPNREDFIMNKGGSGEFVDYWRYAKKLEQYIDFQERNNIKEFELNKFCQWLTETWSKQIHIPFGYEYAIKSYLTPNKEEQEEQPKEEKQSFHEFMKENGLGPEDMINDVTY